MKPNTICHPEALDDWRANDEESTHNYLATVQEQINLGRIQDELDHNTVQKKHRTELEGILALRLKEAIERENRKRGTVRKER